MESSSGADMSLEVLRVASFGQKPLKPVTSVEGIADFTPIPSSLKLSKAGFYRDLSSDGDEVRCFSCGLVMKDWSAYYGESPFSVHLCRSPECPFLSCQSADDTSAETDISSPYSGRSLTPLSPELFLTSAESTIIRRQLFPEDDNVRTNDNSLTNAQVQSMIKLPFIPKFGSNNMLFECKRYATFAAKPCLKAKELASSGFVMLTGDKVGCVFCGEQTTCPTAECTTPVKEIHRALNSNCPFFRGFDVSNVSCGLEELIKRDSELSDSNTSSDSDEDNNTTNSSVPCMFHNPFFEDFTVRKETFKDWPPQMKPTAQKLAEAGFYYTGTFDKVTCFNCGCSLSKWLTDADALVQHAKHSPSCLYLQQLPQYHDIKQLAMETQEMTSYEMPTEDGPVSNQSPVKLPFPFKPTVDPSILTNCQAALANSYPNYDLLVGWMLTTRKEFQLMREMRSNIHSQEVTLKDQHTQLHEHRQQIHHKDQQIHQQGQQIHQQGQQIHQQGQQIHQQGQQIHQQGQQIHQQGQQIHQQGQQIHHKDQQLEELSSKDEEIHQLRLKLNSQNQQITQITQQKNRLIMNKNELLQVQGGRIDQLEDDNIRLQNLVMQLRRELQVSTSRRG